MVNIENVLRDDAFVGARWGRDLQRQGTNFVIVFSVNSDTAYKIKVLYRLEPTISLEAFKAKMESALTALFAPAMEHIPLK